MTYKAQFIAKQAIHLEFCIVSTLMFSDWKRDRQLRREIAAFRKLTKHSNRIARRKNT